MEVLWEDAGRVFCRLGATMPKTIDTLSYPSFPALDTRR